MPAPGQRPGAQGGASRVPDAGGQETDPSTGCPPASGSRRDARSSAERRHRPTRRRCETSRPLLPLDAVAPQRDAAAVAWPVGSARPVSPAPESSTPLESGERRRASRALRAVRFRLTAPGELSGRSRPVGPETSRRRGGRLHPKHAAALPPASSPVEPPARGGQSAACRFARPCGWLSCCGGLARRVGRVPHKGAPPPAAAAAASAAAAPVCGRFARDPCGCRRIRAHDPNWVSPLRAACGSRICSAQFGRAPMRRMLMGSADRIGRSSIVSRAP
jgi:hypothetical protein